MMVDLTQFVPPTGTQNVEIWANATFGYTANDRQNVLRVLSDWSNYFSQKLVPCTLNDIYTVMPTVFLKQVTLHEMATITTNLSSNNVSEIAPYIRNLFKDKDYTYSTLSVDVTTVEHVTTRKIKVSTATTIPRNYYVSVNQSVFYCLEKLVSAPLIQMQ